MLGPCVDCGVCFRIQRSFCVSVGKFTCSEIHVELKVFVMVTLGETEVGNGGKWLS